MISNILRDREIRISYDCKADLLSQLNKLPAHRQHIDSIFPLIGPRDETIVLGFSSCGQYLISFHKSTFCRHKIILSRERLEISECDTYYILEPIPTNCHFVSLMSCVVEYLSLRCIDVFIITVYAPYENVIRKGDAFKLICVNFGINEHFRCLATSISEKVYRINTKTAAAFINSGHSITAIAITLEDSPSRSSKTLSTVGLSEGNIKTMKANSFVPIKMLNIEPIIWSSGCPYEFQCSSFQAELVVSLRIDIIAKYLFLVFFKESSEDKIFCNYNADIIGPTDDKGSLWLSVSLLALDSGRLDKSTSKRIKTSNSYTPIVYVISCNPWTKELGIVKFCCLAQFGLKNNFPFHSDMNESAIHKWFDRVSTLYCEKITAFYSILFRHKSNLYCISNRNMFEEGQSLEALRHPWLPIEIVNNLDE